MNVTRFPEGVTDVVPGTFMGDSGPVFDFGRYIRFTDDFTQFIPAHWDIIGNTGGTVVRLSEGEADGVLELFVDSAGGTPLSAQNLAQPFRWDRPTWVETRVKKSIADEQALIIGLTDDNATVRSRIGVSFLKETGLTTLNLAVNNGAETLFPTTYNFVSGVYVRLGMYFDGLFTVTVFADDEVVGVFNIQAALPSPAVPLTPSLVHVGNAFLDVTMSVDYFNAYQRREL
ncbi:MAG: hypothetical protein ACR2PR_08695 [Pseudohongiellaceae bacterium]